MFEEATWGIDTIAGDEPLIATLAPPVIWAYVTGTTQNPDIEWNPQQLANFPHSMVYKIDQGFGSRGAFDADEFDMEARAWTIEGIASVIEERNSRSWSTRVYAGHQPWAGLLNFTAINRISMRSVYWRVADWNPNEPTARNQMFNNPMIYAWQWASPGSNPTTFVPGTTKTLRDVGADLNVCKLGSTLWRG